MANISKKDFERMLGRMQDEDYITSDEFYAMFNKVIEAVKDARVKAEEAVGAINSKADKKQKELDGHFVKLLKAVDARMKKVENGKPGKDGTTPIAGVDYPDYQEVRDFIRAQVESLPQPQSATEVITVDYIKAALEGLEGRDRLSYTAIDGLDQKIDETFRMLESATSRGPKFVHGGVSIGGPSGGSSLPSGVQGDIIYHNGTDWVVLNAGTDGQFLKTQGSGANPLWATLAGGGDLLSTNNLSDLADAATARTNLGVDAAGTDNSTDVTLNAALTDVFSLSTQELSAVDNAADGIVGWDDSLGKLTYLSAADIRTVLNVEDGADVTDTANVTAAGALMDSEITNLADVKAFDPADYATAAQGSTADSAIQDGDTFTPADHGTATNPEVVAVVYGTSTPPTASTTPIGTLFVQYTA